MLLCASSNHYMAGDEIAHYLTKEEVAQRLGLKRRGIEAMMARRVLPFIRLSHRCVRFDWVKVQEEIGKFEVKSASQK